MNTRIQHWNRKITGADNKGNESKKPTEYKYNKSYS